jgi:hypothetical protein
VRGPGDWAREGGRRQDPGLGPWGLGAWGPGGQSTGCGAPAARIARIACAALLVRLGRREHPPPLMRTRCAAGPGRVRSPAGGAGAEELRRVQRHQALRHICSREQKEAGLLRRRRGSGLVESSGPQRARQKTSWGGLRRLGAAAAPLDGDLTPPASACRAAAAAPGSRCPACPDLARSRPLLTVNPTPFGDEPAPWTGRPGLPVYLGSYIGSLPAGRRLVRSAAPGGAGVRGCVAPLRRVGSIFSRHSAANLRPGGPPRSPDGRRAAPKFESAYPGGIDMGV